MQSLHKKWFTWIFITLVLAIAFLFLIDYKELYDQTFFYVFQERDIERARNLLKGQWIFFGPELTGGGNLPGPLYYFCLAAALFFKSHWHSAWIMQFLFAFAGAMIGLWFFQKKKSPSIAVLWFIFFATAPMTFRFLQIFLNVSSLLPFCVAALVFIYKTFNDTRANERHASFVLACLSIGLGIQFHYSLICLMLALLFMAGFAGFLKLEPVQGKTIRRGLLFFMIPSVPYLLWVILKKAGIVLGDPGFYVGEVKNAPASLAYLLQFGLATNPEGFWLGSLKKVFFTFPFPLFFIFLAAFLKKLAPVSDENQESLKHLKPLFICLIFSIIPYLNWYFSSQAVRYTMPFYVNMLILNIFCYQWMIQSRRQTNIFNFLTGLFFIVYTIWVYLNFPADIFGKYIFQVLFAAFIIMATLYFLERNTLYKVRTVAVSLVLMVFTNQAQFLTKDFKSLTSYHWALFLPQTYEWTHIWEIIHQNTGWDYEYAKKRIYYAGHHLEQSPQLFLDGYKFKTPVKLMEKMPDGFFISNRVRLQKATAPFFFESDFTKFIPRGWLIRQNLQPEVKEALSKGSIQLGKNMSEMILIVPYWVKDKKVLPQFFHNSGEGYKLSAEDKLLNLIPESQGIKKLAENEFLFKWNEKIECGEFCATGSVVKLEKQDAGNYTIRVKAIGFTLSQISPWINPNWTEAWIRPYVEIGCGHKKFRYLISNAIGFRRDASQNVATPLLQGNNSFVAPFERDFDMYCEEKITSVEVGRESSAIETIQQVFQIKPVPLKLDL